MHTSGWARANVEIHAPYFEQPKLYRVTPASTQSISLLGSKPQFFSVPDLSGFESLFLGLSDLGRWKENWDGYGASRISANAIRDARRFLNQLPRECMPPKLMGSPDGAVGLFWEEGDLYISLEFAGDETYSFIADRGADTSDGEDMPARGPLPAMLLERIPVRA